MEYQGKISGIGNAITRKNEITDDDLAILREFIFGFDYGVLNKRGWNFNANADGSRVILEKGIMFAYGFLGYLDNSVTFNFIKPSATQYRFIYCEIDRSVIPNTFKIKVKNNQGSDKIKPTTFRQDYLRAVRTGVFQLPLWRVELNNQGIVEIVDVRELKDYIDRVYWCDKTTKGITKKIEVGALAHTQPYVDRSKKNATTEYVHLAIRNYIDNQ